VLSSIESNAFVEGRFFREFDESNSFGFAIISSKQFNLNDVSALIEEIFDVAIVGIEGQTLYANLELSIFIFVNNFG
jgi:hypothetical protein